ncbi:MAG TPA: N-acetylglucosamine-specific PTS transporter subunit IIBC [Kofleriaceae bacterium]|jgi:PTS system N-acetylglucosamine-specific IIC component|nr:N-acetylglucosamine-specific PTS transporter subunit IIBC [Kofleriaceae bacterium]
MVTLTQKSFAGLQKLGRALMLPIAVMPLAALLLRLGQPDLLNIPFVAAAGDAIFSNLGMLFAVGVAIGFAKESHGAAGLAGAVGFFVTVKTALVLVTVPPETVAGLTGAAKDLAVAGFKDTLVAWTSIPVGILAGLIAGSMYNRFKDIKLPDYLAFFGGRRFVPIVTGFCCLGLGVVFGYGWPYVTAGLDAASRTVLAAGEAGHFVYGVLNRLLLVTGLHHIVNNFAWLLVGTFRTATGELVTGDLKRFFAGDPSAGAFMAGFFPVMMFGLPAACLAMYRAARPENRRLVGGVLLSMALTSFLTGVTEPIEFAFMFLAPVLYLIHAVLTGLALVIMSMLDVKLGFGFSAGLFDYVINFKLSTHPLLMLPVGAAYFVVYYSVFRYAIAKFDLKTLGREPEGTMSTTGAAINAALFPGGPAAPAPGKLPEPATARGASYLAALGGAANVLEVEACATRLRLSLVDAARLDEAALTQLGARGVLRLAKGTAQIIIGPLADQVAGEIQDAMRAP